MIEPPKVGDRGRNVLHHGPRRRFDESDIVIEAVWVDARFLVEAFVDRSNLKKSLAQKRYGW